MSLISLRKLSTASTSHLATFCHDLESRGLVENSYPSGILKDDHFKQLPNVLYAGFDPTAESLHVGNLVVVASLLRAALHRCHSIAIIGGATALIGDPSGKQDDRAELARNVVEHNASRLMLDLRRFTSNVAEMTSRDLKLDIFNNIDWYENMTMIDFLRLSRKFRVGPMLRLGHIKNRMKDNSDSGVNFTEFSYQILQSYDWKVLAERHDCLFQLGGSDQLGHLDIGYHYIKNTIGKRTAGICLPLITDAFGNKIGKSSAAKGDAVWLNPELTSPYALYQYFRQLHDDSAEKLLPYFSLRSIEEIRTLISDHNKNLGKWVAQTVLADEVTEMVHGKSGLLLAKQCSNVLFNGKNLLSTT
ncbi:hypothetical protein FO519_009442 [Halicephalobus sp. NKZ332]|nr:hypothetical protein FO519_009442 [Halicephalobus sp. NKZ332]